LPIPLATARGLVLTLLASALAVAAAWADGPAPGRPAAKARPRAKDRPPPCPLEVAVRRAPARPPARSMPEMFARMGEGFARDPIRGMQDLVDQVERLEGPALQGVTLSAAEERAIGRRAFEAYLADAARRGYRRVEDPRRLGYLRSLVDGLARKMAHRARYRTLEVALIDAPIAEGQSFPGGYFVFTTALLEEPDEATVAGVVAHELAHLDEGHLYDYARRTRLAEVTYRRFPGAPGNGLDVFLTRQMALLGLMLSPFRPEHEHRADCVAATWLFEEGYDPSALVEFFERMHARQRDVPADGLLALGRSHPFTLDRREHVQARLRQLHAWKPRHDLGRYAENLGRLRSRFAVGPGP
jgi:predicted Zn-dependent protease